MKGSNLWEMDKKWTELLASESFQAVAQEGNAGGAQRSPEEQELGVLKGIKPAGGQQGRELENSRALRASLSSIQIHTEQCQKLPEAMKWINQKN